MRKFLNLGGLLGLIISLTLLLIPKITDLDKSDTLKDIYFLCIEFFGPNSLMLMVLGSNEFDIWTMVFVSIVVGINVGLYVFFGWLCWQGVTKNRLFFALPPGILLFVYFIFWDLF